MQQLVLGVLTTILALPVAAVCQEPVDFTGVWKMDASRSESAHQAVPIGPVTMAIRQNGTELSVETRRQELGKSEASVETLTFRLDGSETTSTGASGVPVQVKARWEGPRLVTETARQVRGAYVTTMQVFTLDPSGREMTVDKSLTVQHGYQFQGAKTTGRGKDVFVRAKPLPKK
jgi:hypothetical protein